MGDVINFDERKCYKDLDSDYFKYVNVIHNHLGVPKSPPILYKTIYFTCRFLDKTIETASILLSFGLINRGQMEEFKEQLLNFLNMMIDDVKKL